MRDVEGILEDQWCYEKNGQGRYAAGMKARKNYLQLTGYRLPTEAEWEFACRAETTTTHHFGLAESLLPKYAHFNASFSPGAASRSWPVGGLKPNEFGMFDLMGNAKEWCHDGYTHPKVSKSDAVLDELTDERPLTNDGFRVLRGGSYDVTLTLMRSASRERFQAALRSVYFGFRLSRSLR